MQKRPGNLFSVIDLLKRTTIQLKTQLCFLDTDRHTGRQSVRQTDRQTGRQTVRQTDRQVDRQLDRQTYR